jgi:hypothetical protein
VAVFLLAGCASSGSRRTAPPLAAYVLMNATAGASARAVVSTAACPDILVDGAPRPMALRAAPRAIAPRTAQGKDAVFPVSVCEFPLPADATTASIAGQPLPLPMAEPRRIVVIGDTGCRIKASERRFQSCSDPAAWPFAAVAQAAARQRPDLVIHVGDYHYRETRCPVAACADSPWGYGWDAWSADLFVPAQALFAAAPWVVTRGNHEECARAGQGWFRLLDPRPFVPRRSCDLPRDDGDADFTEPYAVSLGEHWQLIMFDSARAGRLMDPAKPRDAAALAAYTRNMQQVRALADVPGMHSLFISHHPVLGFSVSDKGAVSFGNLALLSVMQAVNGPRYFPAGVDAALHGHVHTFEAIDFTSAHPSTIVAGHGGDWLEAEVPVALASSYPSAPGVQVDFAAHAPGFGYLVMEREGADWHLQARALDGTDTAQCILHAGHLDCTAQSPISRPEPPASLLHPAPASPLQSPPLQEPTRG